VDFPVAAADTMIKKIRITNFKSLEDVTVSLEPVTILIGPSGSGKTNVVQAIKWLRDFLSGRDAQFALQACGNGWDKVRLSVSRTQIHWH
jgi:AAA15 family ATPase/GTPase